MRVAGASCRIRIALLPLVVCVNPVFAQDQPAPEQSASGQISLTYQYGRTDGFGHSGGTIPLGTTDTHVLNVEVDFALNDRWTLSGSLPYITKRYEGPFVHDPLTILPPRTDVEFLDDGDYHSDFQDLRLGVRYLARTDPLIVEPFIFLGAPTSDYVFFSHAAVGKNLQTLEVGVNLSYQPPFSNFYFRLSPSREFVEEVLGVDTDQWRLTAEVGYFVNARLAVKALVFGEKGHGFATFDFSRMDDELWFQHDRVQRQDFVNAGFGVDWTLNERNRLSGAVFRMAHAEDLHVLEYAINITLSRSF